MDQKAQQIRRSQWEQIVLEGNRASISKKEWCRQNGISEKSFYYWQRKIRSQAAEALESEKAVPVCVGMSSSSFVELPFGSTAQTFSGGSASPGLAPELMIQIGDCRVYVAGTIREQTLSTALKVIRHA